MKNVNDILAFASLNKSIFESDLMECLKIPSISTLSEHHNDIVNCAEHVINHLDSIGLTHTKMFHDYGNPIIYADNGFDSQKKTVLLYGHYDVQPVDPLNLWDTPPFEPSIRNNYIYARGASDNKGMFYAQIKAVQSFLAVTGNCPVNIKFIIEGEEEIGSSGLESFIKEHTELLHHDAIILSDSPKFSDTSPSVCGSIRGLIYMDVTVSAINHDVHSGQLGGGVPNVIHYVSSFINSIKDPQTNRILIPGFYDDVLDPNHYVFTDSMKEELDNLADFYRLGDHANPDFFKNLWFLPTLDCNGISSGFTAEGAKTVIPQEASFKLSARLVGQQDPAKIYDLISKTIHGFFPDSFEISIQKIGPFAKPMSVDTTSYYFKMALKAQELTHDKEIITQGEGGSIPILAEFQALFNKPIILIGLNSPNDNIHAPNERFKRNDYHDGIRTYIHYLHLIGNGITN